MIRPATAILILAALVSRGAAANPPDFSPSDALYVWTGEGPGDQLGNRCATAGDVDNDGYADVLVGSRLSDANGVDSGRAFVFSGATGAQLHVFTGEAPGDELGHRIRALGDVDDDGFDDLMITGFLNDAGGADAGRVYIYSGRTGELMYSLTGEGALDNFGFQSRSISGSRFLPETKLLIGAHRNDQSGSNAGKVYLYLAATGEQKLTLTGEQPDDHFGFRVRVIGDVDDDTADDFLVAAPRSNAAGFEAGRAYLYSSRTGALLQVFDGEGAGDRFGERIAAAGDLDRDGYCDILVASISFESEGPRTGRVYAYSGRTGKLLYKLTGEGAGDEFGDRLLALGDVDGDGYDDFAVGAWLNGDAGTDAGKTYVYSGRTGGLIHSWTGEAAGDKLGKVIHAPGDINRDGHADIMLAAKFNDTGGNDAGRIYAYSGRTGTLLFTITGESEQGTLGHDLDSSGDINQDGQDDFVVSAPRYNSELLGPAVGRVYAFLSYPLNLAPSAFRRGRESQMVMTGAGENETVYLLASVRGIGAGPIIAQLGGLSLDLLAPVQIVRTATADLNGTAVFSLRIPENFASDFLYLQAVAARGSGGEDSVKSNPVAAPVRDK